jgi:hypothetical protein
MSAPSGSDDLASLVVSAAEQGWPAALVRPPARGRRQPHAAQAAFVYPLAHAAALRVSIPLSPPARHGGTGARATAGRQRACTSPLAALPAAADVVRSWQAQTRRGVQVELPPGRLADAVEANRRYLLLLRDGGAESFGLHRLSDRVRQLVALDRWGFHAEAAEIAAAFSAHQHADGRFSDTAPASPAVEPGAHGSVLWALAEHDRLAGDSEAARSMAASIADAAGWIERTRHPRRRPADPAQEGMPPSGTYAEAFWSLRGLIDSAALLRAAGEDEAAARVAAWAASFKHDVEVSLGVTRMRLGDAIVPAGPQPADRLPNLATLEACSILGLLAPTDPALLRTLGAVREAVCAGPAVRDPGGPGGLVPGPTLRLAGVELTAGDRAALDRLAWVVESASETFTWPAVLGGGAACPADGHDAGTVACFCSLVRQLLVHETPGGLALCTMLPEGWTGHSFEVHAAPTSVGPVSFAVRWHAERPLLLWERRGPPPAPVLLQAPGLDPSWSSRQPEGEVLLRPFPSAADRRRR